MKIYVCIYIYIIYIYVYVSAAGKGHLELTSSCWNPGEQLEIRDSRSPLGFSQSKRVGPAKGRGGADTRVSAPAQSKTWPDEKETSNRFSVKVLNHLRLLEAKHVYIYIYSDVYIKKHIVWSYMTYSKPCVIGKVFVCPGDLSGLEQGWFWECGPLCCCPARIELS